MGVSGEGRYADDNLTRKSVAGWGQCVGFACWHMPTSERCEVSSLFHIGYPIWDTINGGPLELKYHSHKARLLCSLAPEIWIRDRRNSGRTLRVSGFFPSHGIHFIEVHACLLAGSLPHLLHAFVR